MHNVKCLWLGAMCACLMSVMTPASAVTDMDDNPIMINTLVGKGKWTVVEIWASDCRMCQLSIQHIVNFKLAHPNVDIVGISVDGQANKANAQTFIEEQRLSFPNLLSHKNEIDQYLFDTAGKSFIGTPTFLFYDPKGKLLTVQSRALTEIELGKFIDSQQPQPEIAEPC